MIFQRECKKAWLLLPRQLAWQKGPVIQMIKINLRSDKEKKERLTDEKVGTIVRLGFSVVFSLLILSLVMFSALIILDINLKSVKEESKTFPTGSARETQEAEELLKEVNEASQKIESNL